MKKHNRILVFLGMLFILPMSFPSIAFAETAGITIDGYYDDWENKPITVFTWLSNNTTSTHDVCLIKDQEYIYIYLRMNPNYRSSIPIDSINLYINGRCCPLYLRYENKQHTTDWWRNVNLNFNRIITDLHPFTYYPNYSLGDAAVTVSDGDPNDRMEIRVKIKSLEKVMNLRNGTINNNSQIVLRMPNVGAESIELLGTSTGTVAGITLCIGTVILVNWRRKYIKKR